MDQWKETDDDEHHVLYKRAVYNDTSGLWYRLGEHHIVADGVEAMSYSEAFEKLYGDVKRARVR